MVFTYTRAGNGWLTLLNPVLFNKIGENTLHVFGAVNFLSIPLVWALYPETANRTLEEMDFLFMSDSPFVWNEEANFRRMKEEMERSRAEGRLTTKDSDSIKDDEKADPPTMMEVKA